MALAIHERNFRKKGIVKSLLYLMSGNYDSCSRRASYERAEPKVVLIVLS